MCVALPGRVLHVEPDGRLATVEMGGEHRTVDLALTPEAGVGDWIIAHSGFAVRTLDPEDAASILATLAEIGPPG